MMETKEKTRQEMTLWIRDFENMEHGHVNLNVKTNDIHITVFIGGNMTDISFICDEEHNGYMCLMDGKPIKSHVFGMLAHYAGYDEVKA